MKNLGVTKGECILRVGVLALVQRHILDTKCTSREGKPRDWHSLWEKTKLQRESDTSLMFSDHNYGLIIFDRHLKHKCAVCQSRMLMFVSHFVVLRHSNTTLLEAEAFDCIEPNDLSGVVIQC